MPSGKLFIDLPPKVFWTGSHFDLTAETGDVRIERALSRHAGIGVFLEFRREIQRSEGAGVQEVLRQLEAGFR